MSSLSCAASSSEGLTDASSSAAQQVPVSSKLSSAYVSSTPSIEIDDTGSSSDESDGEEAVA